MKTKSIWYFMIGNILIWAILLIHSKWYLFYSRTSINPASRSELISLALKSLETKDVPVSAVILYKNKILGRGYNTVLRNLKAGEHAEINAISDAVDHIGMNRFMTLDRDSLWIISTFEPCPMCAGALIMYNVKRIYFLKEKSFLDNFTKDIRFMRYYFMRNSLSPASIQDSLFELHPDYKKNQSK